VEAPELETAVIGAGVVGLATARALARSGRDVVVLEAESAPGRHQSSRNSGVLHAGLHHAPGSLRARLCVEGRRALVAYCAARGVPHAVTGKLVVAANGGEAPALEALAARGRANGVEGLRLLGAAEARALEPEVSCAAALLSPSTGIVDPEALLRALLRDAEDAGARVALGATVMGGAVLAAGIALRLGGSWPGTVSCREVVNAAGLGAQGVALSIEGLPATTVPPAHPAKGQWFVLAGRAPFRRLVYPLPEPGGLGVHLTLDLAGAARFGPDIVPVDRVEGGPVDYRFDESRAPAFEAAVRRFWPGLPSGALRPGFAGVRARITPPGAPASDFAVFGPAVHGVPGLVCLYGIESPGLTACLAIAEHVRSLLDDA
jgi:L-2-hydroxyglutarate oxidase LhgO